MWSPMQRKMKSLLLQKQENDTRFPSKLVVMLFLLRRHLLGMRKHTSSRHGKKASAEQGGDSGSQKILVFGVSNVVFDVTLHKGKRNISSKYYAVYYPLCAAPASSLKIRYPVHMNVHMESQKWCSSYFVAFPKGHLQLTKSTSQVTERRTPRG